MRSKSKFTSYPLTQDHILYYIMMWYKAYRSSLFIFRSDFRGFFRSIAEKFLIRSQSIDSRKHRIAAAAAASSQLLRLDFAVAICRSLAHSYALLLTFSFVSFSTSGFVSELATAAWTMSCAFILKINGASTAIVHPQVVETAVMPSNSNSLTYILANQNVRPLVETKMI